MPPQLPADSRCCVVCLDHNLDVSRKLDFDHARHRIYHDLHTDGLVEFQFLFRLPAARLACLIADDDTSELEPAVVGLRDFTSVNCVFFTTLIILAIAFTVIAAVRASIGAFR